MKFVPDIENWSKWWSVRLALASSVFGAVTLAYVGLPPDWLPEIPRAVKVGLAMGTLVTAGASAFARGIAQPKLDKS